MVDIARLRQRLTETDALRAGDKIVQGMTERIQPEYAAGWPSQLDPAIPHAFENIGISQPYQHQIEAISKSLDGADVVMESPTASGKTVAFTAPMLDALLQNPNSHALMIYPMKALIIDQREQIRQICEPLAIEAWPYDGDTDRERKYALRNNPPQILLTTPEYLQMSFLGWREQWQQFLRNLCFVVIDEMHEYRGFFGGNMALLLRRFFLHLTRLGATPQVFLSTATCANPGQHAKALTGRDVEVVSARSVLRPRRHFVFVNPDIPDFQYRDILRLRVENAALAAMAEDIQVLVFCPTKRFLEEAFGKCQARAGEMGLDQDRLAPFHADLTSEKRLATQQKIKSGSINIVFTTNALELGLDIGGLDGVILAGFPASIMSAWQQIGRAGRSWDRDAFVLLYAMNDPIDGFFVGNLQAFLDKPFDELVIDPNNEDLISNHLPSLVAETQGKLRVCEETILGDEFYRIAKDKGGQPVQGRYKPHFHLEIRGNMGQLFKLKSGDEEIGQISTMRKFREAYIGAIFTFLGIRYRVHSHEENAVVLSEAEPYLKTESGFYTVLYVDKIFDGAGYGDLEVFYGTLNITSNFTGYKLVDERSGEEKGSGGASDALFLRNLHAFWMNVPEESNTSNGIGALEHLIRVGAMFVIPADRFDTSTYSNSKSSDDSVVYFYENHSSGIGIAKKLFEVWPTALEKGREIALHCSCKTGCPNCIEPPKAYNVSNESIDKEQGIAMADKLLASARVPDRKFVDGMMISVIH